MIEAQTDPHGAYAETLADLLASHRAELERVLARIQAHCHGNLCEGHADEFKVQHDECLRLMYAIEATSEEV